MADKPLTVKQERFIKEYREENKPISPEFVMKGFIVCYLQDDVNRGREYTAWLISRIKPQYYLSNMEELIDLKEIAELAGKWQSKIDRVKKSAQKRRHDKREDFALTDDEWIQTVTHFDESCVYCGSKSKLTYDHFIAFSKGGSFKQNNILPCCKKCNSSKNDKDFAEWYIKQSFYSEEREQKIVEYIADCG